MKLTRERVATMLYILMRDYDVQPIQIASAINDHALKVGSKALFSNQNFGVAARVMANEVCE